ncbi:hypothetical protein AO718_21025, partial [Aeromonas veronii]
YNFLLEIFLKYFQHHFPNNIYLVKIDLPSYSQIYNKVYSKHLHQYFRQLVFRKKIMNRHHLN